MGYPTDDDFEEAHGWNKNRPRLSEADRVAQLKLQFDRERDELEEKKEKEEEGKIKFIQRILRARSLAARMKVELEGTAYVSDPDDTLEVVTAFLDFFEYAQGEGTQREEKTYPRDPLYDPDEMPGHEGKTRYD